jgi:hypothetical protein
MSVTTHSTSAEGWGALVGMFVSHTRAQFVNMRIALAMTRRGSSTMAEYYSKMKNCTVEMAIAGHCLGDEEFVAYVLTGLDEEIYNPFVSSIGSRLEPISPSELYSQMLSYELRLEKQSRGADFSTSPQQTLRLVDVAVPGVAQVTPHVDVGIPVALAVAHHLEARAVASPTTTTTIVLLPPPLARLAATVALNAKFV